MHDREVRVCLVTRSGCDWRTTSATCCVSLLCWSWTNSKRPRRDLLIFCYFGISLDRKPVHDLLPRARDGQGRLTGHALLTTHAKLAPVLLREQAQGAKCAGEWLVLLDATERDLNALSRGEQHRHGTAALRRRLAALRASRKQGDTDAHLMSVISQVEKLEEQASQLERVQCSPLLLPRV